jgi:hypothetical protein
VKTKAYMKEEVSIGELLQEDAVNYCERVYPQTTEEFKNISVGTALETKDDVKLSLTGLWFRINDKVQRLKQLVVLGQPDEVGESIQDTYEDLSVYGVIAQLVQRGKWAK